MRPLALAALLFLPSAAGAHEVLHEVHPGGAVALKFFESDGDLLDGAPYEVWSPADGKVAWQKGRTDRAGWLSFVPASPGRWRVKVVKEDGHGLEVEVDTSTLAAPAPPSPAPSTAAPTATPAAPPPTSLSSSAFVLRPLLGVLLVGALFGGLVLLYRKKPGR
jgi:nickel transport protein